MKHFLQSNHWKTFQASLDRTSITKVASDWSYTAYLEKGSGNTRLYAPYGPALTTDDSIGEALASIIHEARAVGATFARIEPTRYISADYLKSHGWLPVTYQQLNPNRTQVIDLKPSEADILSQMSQNSRNLTRNYKNKGLQIHKSTDPEDIHILTSLLSQVAHRNRITPHSSTYFTKQAQVLMPLGVASLFYMTHQNQPVAAAFVYDSETTRYYAHAAADDAYRKLSPGTALVGYMILDAKRAGMKQFDLYGIAPSNQPNHPWTGFTKFKQSFGGQPVEYSGAWDYPIKKPSYYLYRTYQTIRRRLR